MNINKKKIAWFLALAFGISWTNAGIQYLCNVEYGSTLSLILTATVYMCSPAIAALVVQKLIYKQPVKELGLDFANTRWKTLWWIPVINLVFCCFTILIVLFFGNLLHIEGFGYFSLDQELVSQKMDEAIKAAGASAPPEMPMAPALLFVVMMIGGTIAGLINIPATFGEELGWRGFLYNELQTLGFWKSSTITGFIWGLWHAPIILQGHNYPSQPVLGVGMMIIFCISLSFLMSHLRKVSNSVLSPALLHGMINAVAGGVLFFCFEYSDIIGSIAGLAGAGGAILTFLLFYFFHIVRRQKTITED